MTRKKVKYMAVERSLYGQALDEWLYLSTCKNQKYLLRYFWLFEQKDKPAFFRSRGKQKREGE